MMKITYRLIVFLLLAALVGIAYVGTLNHAFISDDQGITINASSWTWGSTFSHPASFLRQILYLIAYQIGGLSPVFYRLPNILFHIGNSYLIYILASVTLSPFVGLIAASLFTVHPLFTESVTWISGGAYAQYTFFALLSLSLYQKAKRLFDLMWIASFVVFFLSLESSDKAVMVSFLLLLYEFIFGNIRKNWKRLVPFFLLNGFFLSFYTAQIGVRETNLQTVFYQNPGGMENPLIKIPTALATYLRLIFFPVNLTFYHTEQAVLNGMFLANGIILLIYCFSIVAAWRYKRSLVFWLLLFPVSVAPMITPFRISWIVAERYAYFGAIGVIVAASFTLTRLVKNKSVLMFVLLGLIGLLCARTIVRNEDWRTEETFWKATEKVSPTLPNVHHNLAVIYGKRNNFPRAIQEFTRAIELKPDWTDAYYNLALTYQHAGQFPDAITYYRKTLSLRPSLWQPYRNMAEIFFQQKEYQYAEAYIKKAIEKNPTNADLVIDLSMIYQQTGNKQKALNALTEALTLDPKNAAARQMIIKLDAGTNKEMQ